MSEDQNADLELQKLDVIAPMLENAEPGISVGGQLRDRPIQRLLRKANKMGVIRKVALGTFAFGVGFVGIEQALDMQARGAQATSFEENYVAVLTENWSGAKQLQEYRAGLAIAAQAARDVHDHDSFDPEVDRAVAMALEESPVAVAHWFTESGISNPVIRDALQRNNILWVEERGQYMVDKTKEVEPDLYPAAGILKHTIETVADQTGATLPQAAAMLSDGLQALMVKSDLCQTGDESFCITDHMVIQGDQDVLVYANAWNGLMGVDPSIEYSEISATIDMDDFGADGSDNRPQKEAGLDIGAGSAGALTITRVNQESGLSTVVASYGDANRLDIIREIAGEAPNRPMP